jgi:hypothetical protein
VNPTENLCLNTWMILVGRTEADSLMSKCRCSGMTDVADESEAVASADFLENLHGMIPGPGRGEERSSLVASRR